MNRANDLDMAIDIVAGNNRAQRCNQETFSKLDLRENECWYQGHNRGHEVQAWCFVRRLVERNVERAWAIGHEERKKETRAGFT